MPLAVVINGTVGAGKTTTAEGIGELLAARGVAHAVIDVDWLRRVWPRPPADRFHHELTIRNLGAVARHDLEAGARWLVIAGVIETPAGRQDYEDTLGIPLIVCRLQVNLDIVSARLAARHADDEPTLRWHLNRAGELDAVLSAATVDDIVVPVSAHTPAQAASLVVAQIEALTGITGAAR